MNVPDVLELLHLARGRYSSIEARIHVWRDDERVEEAIHAWMKRKRTSRSKSGVSERIDHVWFESPSRWRTETEHQSGTRGFLHVQNERRLWREDPLDRNSSGVFENVGFGDAPDRYRQLLWDPNVLIPELWLEPMGEAAVHGRHGIRVRGTPRETSHDFIVRPPWADEYEVVVDLDRGVLLRMVSRFRGSDAVVEEVRDIAFDQVLPDSLFAIPS